jgi:hypothetical protein
MPVHRTQSTVATAAVSFSRSSSSRQRQRAIAPLYMAAAPKKDKAKKSKDEPKVELVSDSKKNDIYLLKEPVSSKSLHTDVDSVALNVLGPDNMLALQFMTLSEGLMHT